MNCRECLDFLIDYHAGELPADMLASFHEHLAACPPCVDYLNCYAGTVKLAQGAHRDAVEEVPEELIQAILLVRQSSSRS